MINTLKIFNELKESLDPVAAEKIVTVIGSVYEELKNSVTKVEFNELKEVVKELADSQNRTEKSLEQLTESVQQLTGRFDQLAGRLEQLAERMNLFTERMDLLTIRMNELTENVSRLERKVEDLVGETKRINVRFGDMKQEIGGLSHTVGYRLEDEAMKSLPALLKRDFSIEAQDSFTRDYVEIGPSKYMEINIWGHGLQGSKPLELIGEAKSQLKKKDVDKFLQDLKTLRPIFDKEIFPILVTYQTSPEVRRYIEAKNIALYFSYQLQ